MSAVEQGDAITCQPLDVVRIALPLLADAPHRGAT